MPVDTKENPSLRSIYGSTYFMSRSLETYASAPPEISAQKSGDQLRPHLYNPYEYFHAWQETGTTMLLGTLSMIKPLAEQQLRALEMTDEMLGMGKEMQNFEMLRYSQPSLYYGTPETRGQSHIIMTNGFTPYNIMTENAFVAPFLEFYRTMIPQLKSNAFLEPKRKWYERHGHTTNFAFDDPNHIWYQNFIDTYHSTVDALDLHDDVWIDGLSGGGLLGEMVAKKLAGEGAVVNLITNGSPEVSEEMLQVFDKSIEQPGMMGQVHMLAKMSATMDPDQEKMAEEIYEATQRQFHPDSTVIRFYSKDDRVCPKPFDPNAIEVGGKHAVIPYREVVLKTLQKVLTDSNHRREAA
ncbi:MAG: hypothetical protein Q7T54_00925 [Candidatus Levybacteria bacterium]|nr:hypothetical protein [Candidatus Levybacteria bacterium]